MIDVKREVILTHGVTNLNHPQMGIGRIRDIVQLATILQLLVKIASMRVKSVDLATFGVTKKPHYGDTVHPINY